MKHVALFFLLFGVAAAAGAQQMGGQGMIGGQGATGGHGTMGGQGTAAGDRAPDGAMMGSGQSGAAQMGGPGMAGQGAVPLADGEIRKVDKEAKKITIRHGAIPNLDMPPMTMVYRVSDPALLDQVKAGDKVRFAADKVGGAYVVTRIESQK